MIATNQQPQGLLSNVAWDANLPGSSWSYLASDDSGQVSGLWSDEDVAVFRPAVGEVDDQAWLTADASTAFIVAQTDGSNTIVNIDTWGLDYLDATVAASGVIGSEFTWELEADGTARITVFGPDARTILVRPWIVRID